MRLHDTARGKVVELAPREAGKVSMYVCGPTVYDVPHIGHGRFALVFDVLRRYLEWSGNEVRYVSNITDIDDRIIARSNEENRPWEEITTQYEAAWYDALEGLGVRRPDQDPHATAYVDQMVAMVQQLVDSGDAYETADGVYLSSERVDGYGLLARQSLDSLRSGARVDVVEEKRSPVDFALWKKAKPNEPTWPSPWGPGRPGWHTECVVMSLDLLGDDFDIHGGGQDLAFPHHENERAQAVALGRTFARHWVHNGFVEVSGEKMSKSLKNYLSLTDLLERTDGRAYRLLVLQAHYRSPIEVSPETIERAERSLDGFDEFARRTSDLPPAAPDESLATRFRERMDDDLDTPGAMAFVFDAIRQGNSALDDGDTERASALAITVKDLTAAVGLEPRIAGDDIDEHAADLVAQRDAARAARDFAAADALRDELVALGWTVKDTPAGTRIHR